jgi:hypothetical protein
MQPTHDAVRPREGSIHGSLSAPQARSQHTGAGARGLDLLDVPRSEQTVFRALTRVPSASAGQVVGDELQLCS